MTNTFLDRVKGREIDPYQAYTGFDSELQEFMAKLSERHPTMLFARNTTGQSHTIHVFHKGDDYGAGYISYKDHTYNRSGATTYGVFAPSVVNKRYSKGHRERHLTTTTSLDKAIKLASAHLTRPTSVEIAKVVEIEGYRAINSHLYDEQSILRNKVKDTFDTYTQDMGGLRAKPYAAEIFRAFEEGRLVDQEFAADVGHILKLEKETTQLKAHRDAEWTCILIRQDSSGADIASLAPTPIKDAVPNFFDGTTPVPVTTCRVDEIPDNLQGKMAMLSMVDEMHMVVGVGLRVSPRCYHIYSGPEVSE